MVENKIELEYTLLKPISRITIKKHIADLSHTVRNKIKNKIPCCFVCALMLGHRTAFILSDCMLALISTTSKLTCC